MKIPCPNPFADQVTFHFSHVPEGGRAIFRIHDLHGRFLVEEMVNEAATFTWN